jgi:hypothetical protein
MLTARDIQNITMWRNEVIMNRTNPIGLVISLGKQKDAMTGETEEITEEYEVDAVVTERASRIDNERKLYDGAKVTEGDLWFSVSMEQIEPLLDIVDPDRELKDRAFESFLEVDYDGVEYVIVGTDKKGIGIRNRVEFLAKRKV